VSLKFNYKFPLRNHDIECKILSTNINTQHISFECGILFAGFSLLQTRNTKEISQYSETGLHSLLSEVAFVKRKKF